MMFSIIFSKFAAGLIKEDCENKKEPFKIINFVFQRFIVLMKCRKECIILILAFNENPQTL